MGSDQVGELVTGFLVGLPISLIIALRLIRVSFGDRRILVVNRVGFIVLRQDGMVAVG